jgi:hypothetical protein
VKAPKQYAAGFAAKYPSVCPRCDRNIAVGHRVLRRHGAVIHVECAPGADDE